MGTGIYVKSSNITTDQLDQKTDILDLNLKNRSILHRKPEDYYVSVSYKTSLLDLGQLEPFNSMPVR